MSALLRENMLYVFHGNSYICYDLMGRNSEGERDVQELFKIPFSTIDAAFDYGNDIIYFLKGMDCIKYHISESKVTSGYPKKIMFEWKGIWVSDINDVVRIDDKIFFFRKTQYICYDIQTDKADTGYPRYISDDWDGIWESIDGAIYLKKGKVLFFKNNQVSQYDLHSKKCEEGYPMIINDYIRKYHE